MTAAQVAALLQCGVRKVHALRKAGELRAIRLGASGAWRFRPESVRRLSGECASREPSLDELAAVDREILVRRGILPR